MSRDGTTKYRSIRSSLENSMRGYLTVTALQDDGHVYPGMAVERPIIIARKDVMQINIEKSIAWDDPPSPQVRRILRADNEVRRPRAKPEDPSAEYDA